MLLGATLLLLAALALVVAELFLPTHGLLAALAVATAVGSVFLAYRSSAAAAMAFALLIMVTSPVVFYWAIRIYPKTSVGKRVLLDQPTSTTSGFDEEAAQLAQLVGQQGVALTMLRPAGSVEIAGKLVDALSESEVIEAGSRIEVIRVTGLKVFVKGV